MVVDVLPSVASPSEGSEYNQKRELPIPVLRRSQTVHHLPSHFINWGTENLNFRVYLGGTLTNIPWSYPSRPRSPLFHVSIRCKEVLSLLNCSKGPYMITVNVGSEDDHQTTHIHLSMNYFQSSESDRIVRLGRKERNITFLSCEVYRNFLCTSLGWTFFAPSLLFLYGTLEIIHCTEKVTKDFSRGRALNRTSCSMKNISQIMK